MFSQDYVQYINQRDVDLSWVSGLNLALKEQGFDATDYRAIQNRTGTNVNDTIFEERVLKSGLTSDAVEVIWEYVKLCNMSYLKVSVQGEEFKCC